jgi:hypothetical protein
MAATRLEKMIRHKRTRGGVLVPLLEDLFMEPVDIEDDDDVEWISNVLQQMVRRSQDRNHRPLFSPSQLSECLRYVYLLKHHRELGLQKVSATRMEPHYYFFTGNFLHLKWQFALYKLEKKINDPKIFKLYGVEVPIVSKRGDHGGTVDAICAVYERPVITDFKGLNVRTFAEIVRGYIPPQYAVQLTDYGMLYNSQRNNDHKISNALLITESKGGPDPKHPISLHETEIEVSTFLPEVRRRLGVLREHGEKDSIPPPECEKVGSIQFLGCPFRKFCREEVKAIERRKRDADSRHSNGYKVAVPERSRNSRSRGNSK